MAIYVATKMEISQCTSKWVENAAQSRRIRLQIVGAQEALFGSLGFLLCPGGSGTRLRHSNAACEDRGPALTCTCVRY